MTPLSPTWPAGFGIERGLADDHGDLGPRRRRLDQRPVDHQRLDAALGDAGFVAEELGRAVAIEDLEPYGFGRRLARARPCGACLGPLARHRPLETLDLDRATLAAQRILSEIEGKAEGVIKPKRDLAGQQRTRPKLADFVVQHTQTPIESLLEAAFLELEGLGDQGLRAAKLRVGRPHLGDQRRHQPPHHRLGHHLLGSADQVHMAHGPAHDAAQHVATPLIRRHHAVRHQEAHRAQVIGDHAMRDRVLTIGRRRGRLGRGHDERAQPVGVVVVVDPLQHRGQSLEAHAGIDRRARQRHALTTGLLLELHEDKIPNLDETIAIGVGRARRPAGHPIAMVVEYLRARTARPDIAHAPEVVRRSDANDALVGKAADLAPVTMRVVVVVIDGDPELVLGQAELTGHHVPGQLDRDILEIGAKREIAEHLEEGVMAGGVADVVEIVVFAAGAQTLLARHRAIVGTFLQPREEVLELHHASAGEQQRRVVVRHQRTRPHRRMAMGREIVDERLANVVGAVHRSRPIRRHRADGIAARAARPGRRAAFSQWRERCPPTAPAFAHGPRLGSVFITGVPLRSDL